jgi:hypothetical protein
MATRLGRPERWHRTPLYRLLENTIGQTEWLATASSDGTKHAARGTVMIADANAAASDSCSAHAP